MKMCTRHTLLLLTVALSRIACAGEIAVAQPSNNSVGWEFKLDAPIWLAGVEGKSGLAGRTSEFDVAPKELLRRVDMTTALRGEASKGRFGIMGEFIYMSLSDGAGTQDRVAQKVDVQLDQTVGDLAARWRLVEGARGFVDLIGGVRYNRLYQKAVFQPNEERIDTVAENLAVEGTEIRAKVLAHLLALSGYTPQMPVAPLTPEQAEQLANAAEQVHGNVAERKAAYAKILRQAASSTASRQDAWMDPYVGVRAQYNLDASWYLAAKGDVGGFSIGSDLTWQASGALGWRFARNAYAELGYRAVAVDYQDGGFTYDVVTHGTELTLGMSF